MSFSGTHGEYRILGDSQTLAVASAAGTAVTTAAFGGQTYAVLLSATGSISSNSGVRVKISAATDSVVSSVLGCIIVPNFPQVFKITPGQVLTAISNNTASCQLVATELTD